MTAQQRALFAETLIEDEAALQAQLAALQAKLPQAPEAPKAPPRQPRRQALPEQLQRVGEDVSEKLDLIPAQFFGLAGRGDPAGHPFVRHDLSTGQFVSALSTATSTASGPAAAAPAGAKDGWCRSRPSPR